MNLPTTIERGGQRVLTTAQLAENYGTDTQVITNNFNRNKNRYVEGKHYFSLEGEEKREFLNLTQIDLGSVKNSKILYLWTERGALLHAKSLGTDKAWEVYDFLVENYFKVQQKEKVALETQIAEQAQQIQEYQPKASYYDVILSTKDAVSATDIAKDYGKSARWLNQKLHEMGIQFKQGDRWYLYQKYADKGYTCTKTQPYSGKNGEARSKVHMYWTQAGRKFIYDELKNIGIVPVMEREAKAA